MRRRKVFLLAKNIITGEETVCYSGISGNEARYTIAELRRVDKANGQEGLYNYIIKEQNEDGTLERWKGYGKMQVV